jgi:phosphoribosylanthranilate isomerase
VSLLDNAGSRTQIKLCGMTREPDVRLACKLGADAIGLIFAERSPRRLDVERATALRVLASSQISVVALVMDQAADAITAIVERVRPDLLQFHGAEDDAFCAAFGLPFFKALPMRGIAADAVSTLLARYPSAAGFVLDGHAPGAMGGSGERFDWNLLAHERSQRPWLLAGGLDATNVAEAVRALRPWGVDVSSGIESAPGIKDPAKMRAFVAAVREAERG